VRRGAIKSLGRGVLVYLRRGVVARLNWWEGAEKDLCDKDVPAQGFSAILMGKIVFGVIDESGCPKENVGIAVFDDMCDGKTVAACASGVVSGEGSEFVRVVGIEAVPRDDAESSALEDARLVGEGPCYEGGRVGRVARSGKCG